MPVTKVGEELIKTAADQKLPEYLGAGWESLKNILVRGGNAAVNNRPKGIWARAFIRNAAKPVAAAGKFLYHKPEVAVPLAIGATLLSRGLMKDTRKNMYHVDPTYNVTRQTALGQIKYNDPEKLEEYKKTNLFMI